MELVDNFLELHMDYHNVGNKARNWDKMEVLDSSYETDVWILLDDLVLCIL
jgi:hypothetical protein